MLNLIDITQINELFSLCFPNVRQNSLNLNIFKHTVVTTIVSMERFAFNIIQVYNGVTQCQVLADAGNIKIKLNSVVFLF